MAVYRFTDRWLQSPALAPKAGRAEFVDGLCPGLHLRVTANGTKTFSVMYRSGGRLMRRTLGRYPRISLRSARRTALDQLRDAREAADRVGSGLITHPEITYAQLVTAYTEKHLKPNTRTWESIQKGLMRPLMEPFFHRAVASISRREIIDLCDGLVADGKPQAAVHHLRFMKMLFNWAVARDLVSVSPCQGVKPPARTVERDRILSDSEIAAIWRATSQLPTPYGEMYRMFFLTGQRRCEVSTMRWTEILGDLWTIPREKVKKDRPHTVPLTMSARAVLSSLVQLPRFEKDGYVFSTTGGKSASSNFAKVKRQLDQLSDTSGWTIHDIRRTVRSKLAELGVPREVARKVLNHEDGKVDRIYNRHEYLAEKREALEKWEKMLRSLTTQASPTRAL